jgi:Fe-S-cluster containining protein
MHASEPPFAGVNGVAVGSDPYWDALPDLLKSEIAEFRMQARPNSPHERPCIWLDLATKRCRHYEHRPKLCRDFELGGEECVGFRRLHVTLEIAPQLSQ